jgi:hypothetical protein
MKTLLIGAMLLVPLMLALGSIGGLLGGGGALFGVKDVLGILVKLGDGPFEDALTKKLESTKEAVRADMKKNGWLKTEVRHIGDKDVEVDVLNVAKKSKSRGAPAAVIAEIQFVMWNTLIDTAVGPLGKKIDGALGIADKFRDHHHAYVYDQMKHLLAGSQPTLSFDDAFPLVVKAEVEITS